MKFTTTFLLLFCTTSFAQISITSDDLLGLIGDIGIVLTDTNDAVAVNVGAAGENQFWDFSTLSIKGITVNNTFKQPSQTSYADSFPQANLLQRFSYGISGDLQGYFFYNIESEFMDYLGNVSENMGETYLEREYERTTLPLNYGDSWITGEIDTVSYPLPMYDSTCTTIDAWGTITVPAGTFECLRFRYDRYFTYIQRLPGFPPVTIIIDTSTVSYEWYTKDHFLAASVEIPGSESDQNFTNARNVSVLQDVVISSVSENVNTNQPHKFMLQQNYPNPFNPTTMISYQIPMPGDVELSIYNNLGQKVATLVSQTQAAGTYTVNFDATGLAGGIYYCRLKAGNTLVQTRRMLLIK